MLKRNYHTHTAYCNHAKGTSSEMAKTAFDAGYKTFGFSEHVNFQGRASHPRRTSLTDQNNLIKEVKDLKEEYKGKMEVLMGLECELFTDYYDYYKELLSNPDVDYLIIGHHYKNEIAKPLAWGNLAIESNEDVTLYVDIAIEAFKTNLFSMMAHPGLVFSRKEFSAHDAKESERLIKAAIEHNIPFGLNLNGYAKLIDNADTPAIYPVDGFFEIAGKLQAEILIEVDAHKPENLVNNEALDRAKKLIKKYNLNIIDKMTIKG